MSRLQAVVLIFIGAIAGHACGGQGGPPAGGGPPTAPSGPVQARFTVQVYRPAGGAAPSTAADVSGAAAAPAPDALEALPVEQQRQIGIRASYDSVTAPLTEEEITCIIDAANASVGTFRLAVSDPPAVLDRVVSLSRPFPVTPFSGNLNCGLRGRAPDGSLFTVDRAAPWTDADTAPVVSACVPDNQTMCFDGGLLRVTARIHDGRDLVAAQVLQVFPDGGRFALPGVTNESIFLRLLESCTPTTSSSVLVSSRELREMVLDFMNPQMGVRRTIVNPPGGLPETRTFELWRCVGPR